MACCASSSSRIYGRKDGREGVGGFRLAALVLGVALLFPISQRGGNFFVTEYGEPVGRLNSGIWVFLVALSYFVLLLFAQSFLRD